MSTLTQWFTTPRARRLAVAGAIVAVVAILAAFRPVRALADQLLGLFRVQKVIVLPIDSDQLDALGGDSALGQAVGRLFSDSVTVLHEPAPPRPVADAAEASRLAGFEVRLPEGAATTPRLSVQDGSAFEFTVDLARAQTILDAVSQSAAASDGSSDGFEPSDILLPEAIDGATVSVAIPAGVSAEYGDCASMEEGPRSQHPVDGADGVDGVDGVVRDSSSQDSEGLTVFGQKVGDQGAGSQDGGGQAGDMGNRAANSSGNRSGCVMLAQMPSPEVTAPPEIDVASLAETGLRFMGYSPMEAKTFSHTVDWTSTLVLPIPRGSAKSTAVTVDGVDGVLLQRVGGDDRPRKGYTILWVKEGRVYVMAGSDRDIDRGLALANTMP